MQQVPQPITFIDIAINRRFDEAALKQAESASDAVRAYNAGCMIKLLLCSNKCGVTPACATVVDSSGEQRSHPHRGRAAA